MRFSNASQPDVTKIEWRLQQVTVGFELQNEKNWEIKQIWNIIQIQQIHIFTRQYGLKKHSISLEVT